jgi:AraC-like DNA-binding protein
MGFDFYNQRFTISETQEPETPGFNRMWKIHADDSYHVHNRIGFSEHSLFLTLSGTGTIILEGREFILSAPSLLFIESSHPLTYYCPKNCNWSFYFFNYNNPNAIDELGFQFHQLYSLLSSVGLEYSCEHILNEIIINQEYAALKVECIFTELLISCSRMLTQSSPGYVLGIRKVIRWMSEHLHDQLSIEHLLSLSGMVRTVFFSRFKQVTGETPMQYFLKMKLTSAAYLLEHTDKRVYEIADLFGFSDAFHFSKLFKREFGIPPKQYSQQAQ